LQDKRVVEILKEQGCPFVVVLGHPEYYSKFGFEPASVYNIKSQWEGVPDEAFMIAVLDDNSLRNSGGVARYRDEFNAAM
jgi:putative acetyltransferase